MPTDDALNSQTLRSGRPDAGSSGNKEQYSFYYSRFYPLLREGKMNFAAIAKKTGFRERRIREAMLFRLSVGEVMQLFGKKEGYCYICSQPYPKGGREPVCLACLKAIDAAINGEQPDKPSQEAAMQAEGTRASNPEADAVLNILQADDLDEFPDLEDDTADPADSNEPIRHFGFQRMKSKS